jgi:type IV pilus assembly protein PilV
MKNNRLASSACLRHSKGSLLIEVLVSLIVFSVGLLGLAALLGHSQQAEMEAYQRSQALVLLDDMANRIQANVTSNRGTMTCYDLGTDNYLGTGSADDTLTNAAGCSTITDADLAYWDTILKGSTEQEDDANVGAMLGARGCIHQDTTDNRIMQIAVVWQGLTETIAPTITACGEDLYGDEKLRRAVVRNLFFSSVID